jgi:NADPH:quinone reductase-like Zn-dependent oxidoreductase
LAVRAIVLVKHGPPEQALELREWPDPVPAEGQVLIDVHAAGINFADIVARVGLYPDAPKTPSVMGYEVAGVVEALGPGVSGLERGQRVLAATRFTGFAEKAVAAAANVLPLPDRMSFEQGAAIPVNYGTAYAAVGLMACVRPGETVLVHAAAGGVGIAALQLLRERGAVVIGTASAAKHEAVRAQGAEHTIDYRSQDVGREVDRITNGRGVDVVLDALGEFRQSYSMLATGGRLVAYGASKLVTGERRNLAKALTGVATMPRFNALKMMNDTKAVIGMNLLHWWDAEGSLEKFIRPLTELMEKGAIEPVVSESFPFSRAADAHRFIQERRNIGKVVLVPDGVREQAAA